ncbi:Lar family restriction alleviation protein [Novosphingobium sp. G106]|uniref:Lar family restriction alleviation protein n=1 Tax=Novosphingobium sp. G106 TaxID=2849500 RepID=UPI001C2D8BD2|nr:Lar family restriction alleviation protein [Novosphingobium sp. G106]MBV1691403.1 Lar family restriction alleviation protein [Novosphingobium sp. G106]
MPNSEVSRRAVADETGIALTACPFCASSNVGFYEHVYAKHFAVKCNLCGAEGPQRSSPEEAGRLWNRRVQA